MESKISMKLNKKMALTSVSVLSLIDLVFYPCVIPIEPSKIQSSKVYEIEVWKFVWSPKFNTRICINFFKKIHDMSWGALKGWKPLVSSLQYIVIHKLLFFI